MAVLKRRVYRRFCDFITWALLDGPVTPAEALGWWRMKGLGRPCDFHNAVREMVEKGILKEGLMMMPGKMGPRPMRVIYRPWDQRYVPFTYKEVYTYRDVSGRIMGLVGPGANRRVEP